ncbi:aliphatic nitrilase [Aspergillus sclerotiicarbonarius CBS 121057]|uniref:Aliphatic nitrilase n=1 Tax=Aspergillus sclerotiicarbonarius (strain CBS 121057 / IBT 28362) TaxID=1448318 RepID=A0A319EKW2_ASPSB|nr:aliphatic nitrilase [Aspergillus sclerotiicarbonarius CBS 121057]
MPSRTEKTTKVALVRAPPPNWPLPLQNRGWSGIRINILETIQAGLDLIREAKAAGAELIAFPELWFPGFPKWREQNNWRKTHLPSYIENSLEMGSPEWQSLMDGIKSAGIWTALGFSERAGQSIFMSQALISPEGEVVMHRRKLRPSGSERDMFSDGTVDQLQVRNTPLGRVGMLQCAEQFYPSMTFIMAAQRPKLHIGAWPMALDFDDDSDSIFYNASLVTRGAGSYALNSGAYVLMPAVGYCFVYDPLMQIVAHMDNSVDYTEHPLLYHTLPTTELFSEATHDPNAQASWAILQQLNEAFPAEIPREPGVLVPRQETSIEWMTSPKMQWSEIGPATPWPADLPRDS